MTRCSPSWRCNDRRCRRCGPSLDLKIERAQLALAVAERRARLKAEFEANRDDPALN